VSLPTEVVQLGLRSRGVPVDFSWRIATKRTMDARSVEVDSELGQLAFEVHNRRLPTEVYNAIIDWNKGGWIPIERLGTPADVGNA